MPIRRWTAGHARRIADQDGRPLGGLYARFQGQVLVLQIALLGHLPQHRLDLGQLARLGDVVERSQANRVDGRFHAGMAGHNDDFGIRRHVLDLLEHLDAGHAGHAQIENRGVESPFFEGFHGRNAVRAHDDFVAQPRQFRTHELLQRSFIVSEQDAKTFMRCGAQDKPPCFESTSMIDSRLRVLGGLGDLCPRSQAPLGNEVERSHR